MYVPKFSRVQSVWQELIFTLIYALTGEKKSERFPMQQSGFNAASELGLDVGCKENSV